MVKYAFDIMFCECFVNKALKSMREMRKMHLQFQKCQLSIRSWCNAKAFSSMKTCNSSLLPFRLHGSYEAIEQGQTMDALVDLTGGLAQRYEIQGKDPNLYRQIMRASASKAFITCSKKVFTLSAFKGLLLNSISYFP